jgi:hypothetical protein
MGVGGPTSAADAVLRGTAAAGGGAVEPAAAKTQGDS